MVTTRARHSANKVMAHHEGDEHNAGNSDGGIKENDGVHNDGNEGSVGNDVDEVNDGHKSVIGHGIGGKDILIPNYGASC